MSSISIPNLQSTPLSAAPSERPHPRTPLPVDNYLANYTDQQKQRNANDVIWVCAAMTVFGMFFLGIPFQIASLAALATCPLRRYRPSRGGLIGATLIGMTNIVLILSNLYFWIGSCLA